METCETCRWCTVAEPAEWPQLSAEIGWCACPGIEDFVKPWERRDGDECWEER